MSGSRTDPLFEFSALGRREDPGLEADIRGELAGLEPDMRGELPGLEADSLPDKRGELDTG